VLDWVGVLAMALGLLGGWLAAPEFARWQARVPGGKAELEALYRRFDRAVVLVLAVMLLVKLLGSV